MTFDIPAIKRLAREIAAHEKQTAHMDAEGKAERAAALVERYPDEEIARIFAQPIDAVTAKHAENADPAEWLVVLRKACVRAKERAALGGDATPVDGLRAEWRAMLASGRPLREDLLALAKRVHAAGYDFGLDCPGQIPAARLVAFLSAVPSFATVRIVPSGIAPHIEIVWHSGCYRLIPAKEESYFRRRFYDYPHGDTYSEVCEKTRATRTFTRPVLSP